MKHPESGVGTQAGAGRPVHSSGDHDEIGLQGAVGVPVAFRHSRAVGEHEPARPGAVGRA